MHQIQYAEEKIEEGLRPVRSRRGFIYREGSNWTEKHFEWLKSLISKKQLAAEDHLVFSEYLCLLEYKLSRREELDRQIEKLMSPW